MAFGPTQSGNRKLFTGSIYDFRANFPELKERLGPKADSFRRLLVFLAIWRRSVFFWLINGDFDTRAVNFPIAGEMYFPSRRRSAPFQRHGEDFVCGLPHHRRFSRSFFSIPLSARSVPPSICFFLFNHGVLYALVFFLLAPHDGQLGFFGVQRQQSAERATSFFSILWAPPRFEAPSFSSCPLGSEHLDRVPRRRPIRSIDKQRFTHVMERPVR